MSSLLILAMLVACGSTAAPETEGTGGSAAVPTALAAPASGDSPAPTAMPDATASAPAATDQGKYGGIIAGQNSGAVAHWSIWQCGSGGTCMTHTAPLYNGLVQFDGTTAESLDIRGDLAQEWTIDDSGTLYTFHLHENARWWDGMPVTSEDVVFSLNEMVREDVARPRAGQIRPYYQSSRVIDPTTVEVQLNFPSGAFLQYLSTEFMKILPKHHVETGVDMKKEGNILGSGPFKLKEHKKDVASEYEKNEDYFKEGLPYVDGLKYFFIVDSSTVIAAYLSGQVMLTTFGNSNLNIREGETLQERIGDKATVYYPGPVAWVGFMMNTTREPFDDPLVRQAMHLALDRQDFIDIFGNGKYHMGGPFPPDTWFSLSSEELAQLPGYRRTTDGEKHPDDIARAKELLAEAGYPDGFEASILAANFVNFPEMAQLAADQLRRSINVELEVQPAEPTAGYARYEAGDWQAGFHGNGFLILDPDAIIGGSYLASGTRNYSDWEPTEITRLFNEQIKEPDQAKRRQIVQEMSDYLRNTDSHVAITHWQLVVHIVDSRIQNFNVPATLFLHEMKEHLWCDPAC
jgi:peptide/nickel transport system substrate-binding protein